MAAFWSSRLSPSNQCDFSAVVADFTPQQAITLKFARMLLDGGKLGNKRILQSATVDQMSRNQIGDLMLVELRSSVPQFAKDSSDRKSTRLNSSHLVISYAV